MTPKTRNLILGIIAALATISTLLTVYLSDSSLPEPQPSPSPSVVVSPLPSPSPSMVAPSPLPSPRPSPSVSPSPVPTNGSGKVKAIVQIGAKPEYGVRNGDVSFLSVSGSRNENIGISVFSSDVSCSVLSGIPSGVSVGYNRLGTHTTSIPSAAILPVGAHYDAVVPSSGICAGANWLELKISKAAVPGSYAMQVGDLSITLKVWPMTMPDKPTYPNYIELQSAQALRAHKLADNVAYQGPITQKYIKLYRDHKIEPIKQNISGIYPAGDVNQWSAYQSSFKQLVLDGAIADPCIFGPAPEVPPTIAQLQDIEAKIKSGVYPPNSWAYVWDEGEYNDALTAAAKSRTEFVKLHAPSLKVMITRQEDLSFSKVDWFVPVLDWFKAVDKVQNYTKPYGLYTSCMANGTCQNTQPPGTPSGTPMMVLDAPAVNARAFMWTVWASGAKHGLYFNGTQMLPSAWTNQRNEGGNGDGTIAYPGLGADQGPAGEALASWRLKAMAQSSYDLEYIMKALASGFPRSEIQAVVSGPRAWSKKWSDYDALREKMGNWIASHGG